MLLRHDGSYTYYRIEEYQSRWTRWIPLTDCQYLREYNYGEQTSCGDCWQETGQHGIFDLEYAKTFCRKLNEALEKSTLDYGYDRIESAKITAFRVCKVEVSQSIVPIEYAEWLDEVCKVE